MAQFFRVYRRNEIIKRSHHRKNTWFHTLGIAVLISLAHLLSACNDPAGPIGSGAIPTDTFRLITVSSDTLPLIASTRTGQITPKLVLETVTPSALTPAFIGAAAANDVPGGVIAATAFLSFNPLAITDSARNALYGNISPNDILRAELTLSPSNLAFGDTTRRIGSFSIHAVTRAWYADNLLSTINLDDPMLVGRKVGEYQPLQEGTRRIDVSRNLSRKRPLQITDKNLIISWLRANDVVWNNVDGLALVPNSRVARTMFSLTDLAQLVVYIKRATDSVESQVIFNQFRHASLVHAPMPTNVNNTEIVVQGTSAHRTILSFDLSRLPAFAAIHSAELVLPIDTNRSTISNFGFPTSMYLYGERISTFPSVERPFESRRNVAVPPSAVGFFDNTTGPARYVFSGSLGTSTNATANLNAVMENILRNGGRQNLVLQMRSEIITQTAINRAEEEQNPARVVFFGLNERRAEFRPRLVITYSTRYTIPR